MGVLPAFLLSHETIQAEEAATPVGTTRVPQLWVVVVWI
jgi:hypothetical protein